jgi:hypothetical protein
VVTTRRTRRGGGHYSRHCRDPIASRL